MIITRIVALILNIKKDFSSFTYIDAKTNLFIVFLMHLLAF